LITKSKAASRFACRRTPKRNAIGEKEIADCASRNTQRIGGCDWQTQPAHQQTHEQQVPAY